LRSNGKARSSGGPPSPATHRSATKRNRDDNTRQPEDALLVEAIRREAEADPPLGTEVRARLAALLQNGGGANAA
jgi:hypothetical protein